MEIHSKVNKILANTNTLSKRLDKFIFTMYNYNAMEKIIKFRAEVINLLSGKIKGFFLGGGTALSWCYFNHRESYDLDFFTKNFHVKKISNIISFVRKTLEVDIEQHKKDIANDMAELITCHIPVDKNQPIEIDNNKTYLKVDFIEDVYRDVNQNKLVMNGMPIMSKENIYLRKIYAACGVLKIKDQAGNKRFLGGREEAKDFYDLYYLSQTFMNMSKFVIKYCTMDEQESVIRWHKTYDRFAMKSGVLDIITDQRIDCKGMEKHFDEEVHNIIKQMVE